MVIKGFENFKQGLIDTIQNSKDEEELADNLGLVANKLEIRVIELRKKIRENKNENKTEKKR